MSRLRYVLLLLGSPVITILLAGTAFVTYLTVAVWSKEAFAWMMMQLRTAPLAQFLAVLFALNVTVRCARAVTVSWGTGIRLLLKVPLLLGTVMFIWSFLLSGIYRESRWLVVGLDDVIEVSGLGELQVTAVNPALDEQVFRSETTTGIFRYEPALMLRDSSGTEYRVGAYPPRRIGTTYQHVLNFGIGPGVELSEGGRVIARGYVALRLLPFGNVDFFELPPHTDKFYLSILPEETVMRGDRKVQKYDLKRPNYHVEVVRGDRTVFSGEGREGVDFNGTMRLGFFEPSHWVQLELVRDPFLLPFAGGLLLIIFGAVLYPFSWIGKKKLSPRA